MNTEKVLAYLNIKPLVGGWRIKKPDPFNESYIWSPVPLFPVFKRKIATIEARSEFGHPGLFKPSVAEVIDSIPYEFLKKARYFQINKAAPRGDFQTIETAAGIEVKVTPEHHIFSVDLYESVFPAWLPFGRSGS